MSDKSQLSKIPFGSQQLVNIPAFVLDRDFRLMECSEGAAPFLGKDLLDSPESALEFLQEAAGLSDLKDLLEEVSAGGITAVREISASSGAYSLQIEKADFPYGPGLLITCIPAQTGGAHFEKSPDVMTVLETLPDPFAILSSDFSIECANDAFFHSFLVSPQEVLGLDWSLFSAKLQPSAGGESPLISTLKEAGFASSEWRINLAYKGQAVYLVKAKKNTQMGIEKFFVSLKDISKQKKLESSEKENKEKLRLFNDNLKRLTSLAAHDMKEPLVVASIYSELLLEKNRENLDKESIGYLESVMDMVRRMLVLIDNLVALVRMDVTRPLVPLDSQAALDEALKKLKSQIEKSGAVITKERLPQVLGNKVLLVQLFYQLIANAIRFSKDKPQIKISASPNGSHTAFCIEDRGIGFEPADADRIFELFERHSDKELYHGFGTGLPIVKKIVKYHGGEIRAESVPDAGSKFFFTLKNPSA